MAGDDQRYQEAARLLHERIRQQLARVTSLQNELEAALAGLDAYVRMLERLPVLFRDATDPPEEWLKRQLEGLGQ